MRGIRQALACAQLRGAYPVRGFAGAVASTERVVTESGEIGIASGAPEKIYERKVCSYVIESMFVWQ